MTSISLDVHVEKKFKFVYPDSFLNPGVFCVTNTTRSTCGHDYPCSELIAPLTIFFLSWILSKMLATLLVSIL